MRIQCITALLALLVALPACGHGESGDGPATRNSKLENTTMEDRNMSETGAERLQPVETDTAIFGGGCFWCVEAVFEQLDGVLEVESGYTGGTTKNPTYEQVSAGNTGHAEVARIVFDPEVITYEELLDIFWQAHDPTTLNRQGADVGTQYRSAIYYSNDDQRRTAERSRESAQARFSAGIVTEITPLSVYYPAENYHQDYYRRNSNAPYCQVVIRPKLKKLKLE